MEREEKAEARSTDVPDCTEVSISIYFIIFYW